jgi:hypothetical protein
MAKILKFPPPPAEDVDQFQGVVEIAAPGRYAVVVTLREDGSVALTLTPAPAMTGGVKNP